MNFEPLKQYLDSINTRGGEEKWCAPGTNTVIYKDHEEIFSYSTGYADIERKIPTDMGKIYNLYSCSKITTATAALQLIEKGIISVQDPLSKYFPEYENVKVNVYNDKGEVVGTRPPKRPILIKHILSMTSGMGYDLQSEPLVKVIKETDGRAPTLDICRAFAEVPLYFDPGDKYLYSFGLDVMGGVIEVATGMPYSEYVRKNIFEPLGMKNTTFHPDFSDESLFATQYELKPDKKIVRCELEYNPHRLGTEFDGGGAGIASTTDDYVLLLDALANGGVGKTGKRILTSYGVELMRSGMLTDEQIKTLWESPYCMGYTYCYGVRKCIDRGAGGNLAPLGEFGWDGWKVCLAMIDPENRIAVFHTEYLNGYHDEIIPKLRNLIYHCIGS